MKAKDFRNRAWKMLAKNDNYWMLFVSALIAVVVTVATSFLFLLVIGAIMVGLNLIFLNTYRNNEVKIESFIEPFKKSYVNTLVEHLLEMVFIFLWSLLFIVPGIIKAHSYAMAKFILADNPDMEGIAALKASEKLMYGNRWRLFCLRFSFIGWFFLAVLTFGIGFIFLNPYVKAAETAFYLDLIGETGVQEDEFMENEVIFIEDNSLNK